MSFNQFVLKEEYQKVHKLKSNLADVKDLLDWNAFARLFPERETNMGRPPYDKILMIKLLLLQQFHGISDEELEFQVNDRLSFREFLDFPKTIPDYSTVWRFREEFSQGNLANMLWSELQRQLKLHKIKLEKGVIQDARFVQADPGKKSGMQQRGREAKTSRNQDGTWSKKHGKWYFGYKLHTKVQRNNKLITELAVTTAKTFDGHIDLAAPDEIVYRDKCYSGSPTRAKGNASMKKGNLTIKQKLRNKRIAKKRCQGEHPYGTMTRSLNAGRTKLTTQARVFVQQIFVCFAYNIQRLRFLVGS